MRGFVFLAPFTLEAIRLKTFSLPSFYHTSDQIRERLRELEGTCGDGYSIEEKKGDNDGNEVAIDIVKIKKSPSPQRKMFMLHGEHARELISAESALHFIERLCNPEDREAQKTLETTEFVIIPNGNPVSRRRVENGESCLRVNERNVDLNRNWEGKWKPAGEYESPETYPGPKPFSEAQTRIFRDALYGFNPDTFLTVHSGTLGMYIPWASSTKEIEKNRDQMLKIVTEVDKEHCQCPFGSAGKEVGYECAGTCLDDASLNGIPFSFAVEIYANPMMAQTLRDDYNEMMDKWNASQKNQSFLNMNKEDALKTTNFGHPAFGDLFLDHPSDFVQLRKIDGALDAKDLDGGCFSTFNPEDETSYKEVNENWSQAFLEMANLANSAKE